MTDITVIKWIRNNCGNRDFEGVALAVLNALIAVCTTYFAVVTKQVVDAAEGKDTDRLWGKVIILLFAIVIQMAARIADYILAAVSQGKAEIALKTSVFSKILYGKYADMTAYHSGELMTRLTSDVTIVSENTISIVPSLVLNAVKIITSAIALLQIAKAFALVFIGCGILFGIVAMLFRGPLKKYHRIIQEKDGKVRSFMQETIENLFAVKVFGIEERMIKRSGRRQVDHYKAKMKKRIISVIAAIGFSFAFAMGFLAAVAYGAWGISKGTMTFGAVISMVLLVNQFQSPVMGIANIVPAFFSMTASAGRLMEITENEAVDKEEIGITYDEFKAIVGKDVSFGYDDETVIDHADFSIKKGEFVGIEGHSGVGKTTLFKLITGLHEPTGGEIVAETTDGDRDAAAIRQIISFVPQDNLLFSGTIKENLTLLNKDATDDEIQNALKISCADEFINAMPDGILTTLGENGGGISQGQAQRIAIARAIISGRRILLFDESTSSLDSETEKEFISRLKASGDLTVIFISHREAVLDVCDKVIRISNGQLI
ncbi:MAG: ABC transporter ATP-binding protein/permease [Clostridiales bacterium]|nr:ABC transporter ATP-binding protein/permease [Clostridiales bacterium]